MQKNVMILNFYKGNKMNKNRYVERKALCDYDLCEGLFDKLNLTVQDMIPLRKVFLLVTDKGKKY